MSTDNIPMPRRCLSLEELRDFYVAELEDLAEWGEAEKSAAATSRLQTELALLREQISSIEASVEFAGHTVIPIGGVARRCRQPTLNGDKTMTPNDLNAAETALVAALHSFLETVDHHAERIERLRQRQAIHEFRDLYVIEVEALQAQVEHEKSEEAELAADMLRTELELLRNLVGGIEISLDSAE